MRHMLPAFMLFCVVYFVLSAVAEHVAYLAGIMVLPLLLATRFGSARLGREAFSRLAGRPLTGPEVLGLVVASEAFGWAVNLLRAAVTLALVGFNGDIGASLAEALSDPVTWGALAVVTVLNLAALLSGWAPRQDRWSEMAEGDD